MSQSSFASKLLTFVLALGVTSIWISDASAQSRRELDERLVIVEQHLRDLESRFLTGDPAAEALLLRVDALESANRRLTGENENLLLEQEALQSELRTVQAENAQLRDDMASIQDQIDALSLQIADMQINGYSVSETLTSDTDMIESDDGALPAEDAVDSIDPAPADVDLSEMLDLALQRVDEGDFNSARMTLEQYVALDPGAGELGEAYYFLGETYFVEGQMKDAADSFTASLKADPKGRYAPNAAVRLAASLNGLGFNKEACQLLAQFPQQFPNATTDMRAKADLEVRRAECPA